MTAVTSQGLITWLNVQVSLCHAPNKTQPHTHTRCTDSISNDCMTWELSCCYLSDWSECFVIDLVSSWRIHLVFSINPTYVRIDSYLFYLLKRGRSVINTGTVSLCVCVCVRVCVWCHDFVSPTFHDQVPLFVCLNNMCFISGPSWKSYLIFCIC